MATRGMIAKKTENGLVGRYHHSDSYPDALGATLYNLYNGHFNKDAEAMMHLLVDEHPAGWSSINNRDFSYSPGFTENRFAFDKDPELANRPHCYCHGDRHDEAITLTSLSDARRAWAEYAYIIDTTNHTMIVHSRYGEEWQELGTIDLDKEAPDWESLEEDED